MKIDKEKILILTSSGGGGHLQAARAKYLELSKQSNVYLIQKDVFLDFLGKWMGSSFAGTWNFCQAHGKITSLYLFSMCIHYVDILISPLLMVKLIYQILKHDIDRVIDTQPQGTRVFLKSVRLVSWIKKKTIKYEKVLTDLPTNKCNHYFKPFRKLSAKDRAYLSIQTTKPLLGAEESEEDFWKNAAGLTLENIKYCDFPLRPAFQSGHKMTHLSLTFNTYSPEHTHSVCKSLSFGNASYTRSKNKILWKFKQEKLSLITLGSFPQKSVLIEYMLEFIKQKNIYNKDRQDILFLLVGPEKTSISYYHSIIKELEEHKDYPKTLTILPLAFQNDAALAPLYYNLDFIIAKPGGLTTMELIKAVDGSIFIHEGPVQQLSRFFTSITKIKHDAMLPWERGNANYIIENKKAQIITPELFKHVTKEFFQQPANSSLVNAR
jgi:hypothetical protein